MTAQLVSNDGTGAVPSVSNDDTLKAVFGGPPNSNDGTHIIYHPIGEARGAPQGRPGNPFAKAKPRRWLTVAFRPTSAGRRGPCRAGLPPPPGHRTLPAPDIDGPRANESQSRRSMTQRGRPPADQRGTATPALPRYTRGRVSFPPHRRHRPPAVRRLAACAGPPVARATFLPRPARCKPMTGLETVPLRPSVSSI